MTSSLSTRSFLDAVDEFDPLSNRNLKPWYYTVLPCCAKLSGSNSVGPCCAPFGTQCCPMNSAIYLQLSYWQGVEQWQNIPCTHIVHAEKNPEWMLLHIFYIPPRKKNHPPPPRQPRLPSLLNGYIPLNFEKMSCLEFEFLEHEFLELCRRNPLGWSAEFWFSKTPLDTS